MIVGIHHIGIGVSDLPGAADFYRSLAGMHELSRENSAAIAPPGLDNAQCAILAGRNAFLELIETENVSEKWQASSPIHAPGIRHFCVQNRDCAALASAVRNSGGTLLAEPLDLGTGNHYAYARDREGNIVEIEGLPYAPHDEPTWSAHATIVARNLDSLIEFYDGLLGRGVRSRTRVISGPQFDKMGGLEGARIEGAWLPTGNILLEMWQFHAPDYAGPDNRSGLRDLGFSHLAFQSDDLATDLARIEALGGQAEDLGYENPAACGVFARDPEGNLIELVQIADPASSLAIGALADPTVCARIEAGK